MFKCNFEKIQFRRSAINERSSIELVQKKCNEIGATRGLSATLYRRNDAARDEGEVNSLSTMVSKPWPSSVAL